jgi:N6-L-threonylcarbamoyladenine synthase
MRTLGIETSCDETSASVVKDEDRVLSCVISSSESLHAPYGGIIPEIASRAQLETICAVVDAALKEAGVASRDLDLIAVTQGPGLIGSLLVGLSFARSLAYGWKVPLIGVNHVRSHLYAAFIEDKVSFPFVGLVVSGGHTSLYEIEGLDHEKVLGSTRDDAAGEAFDKVAKILGLGYPGGPVLEKLAKKGRPRAYPFRCDCGSGLDFSFSGIKTAVLYKAQELRKIYGKISDQDLADIAASFQEAVVSDLVAKSLRAVQKTKARFLAVGGGVAFNGTLRQRLEEGCRENNIRLFIAPKAYCLDNAAMVASLGSRLYKGKNLKKTLKLDSLAG